MKYKNTETGIIVDVASELKGAWELFEAPAPASEPIKKASVKKPRKTEK